MLGGSEADMILPWMIPLALGIGVAVTRTALSSHLPLKAALKTRWLMLVLAWTPLICWLASQVVVQD